MKPLNTRFDNYSFPSKPINIKSICVRAGLVPFRELSIYKIYALAAGAFDRRRAATAHSWSV